MAVQKKHACRDTNALHMNVVFVQVFRVHDAESTVAVAVPVTFHCKAN